MTLTAGDRLGIYGVISTFILTSGFLLLQTGTPEQHSKLALQATIDYLAYGHTMLKTPVFV